MTKATKKDSAKVLAGRLGGQTTAARYGSAYMRAIGKRGGDTTHARYIVEPWMQSDYIMLDRQTGQPKALFSGKPVPSYLFGGVNDPSSQVKEG